MEELYTYMTPGIMGFPFAGKFAKRFIEFAKNHGVFLHAVGLGQMKGWQHGYYFIRQSIDAGHPVALLILRHRAAELKEDNWHWVTVTGYDDQETAPQIVLSNCGQRQIFPAQLLLEVHPRNTLRMLHFDFGTEEINNEKA